MGTIKDMVDYLPNELYKRAIYNALGNDLTDELNKAGCELTINDDLKRYEFSNITPELQSKIDLKKRK